MITNGVIKRSLKLNSNYYGHFNYSEQKKIIFKLKPYCFHINKNINLTEIKLNFFHAFSDIIN